MLRASCLTLEKKEFRCYIWGKNRGSCMSSGGAPTPAGTSCSPCKTYMNYEVKTWWDMGIGQVWLKWMGHLWLKWVGQLWQSELLWKGWQPPESNPGHLWLEPPVICHWATIAGQSPTFTFLYLYCVVAWGNMLWDVYMQLFLGQAEQAPH